MESAAGRDCGPRGGPGPVWNRCDQPGRGVLRQYRKQLDSDIADVSNLGGKYAGATTAALFLAEFAGDAPWAHLDIAGTMQSDSDDVWRSKGATGFGTRILIELARGFTPVQASSPAG